MIELDITTKEETTYASVEEEVCVVEKETDTHVVAISSEEEIIYTPTECLTIDLTGQEP